jgi:undecaprenyl diphosphate synthase
MDGNGRWAQERNKPRTFGHKQGVDTAKRVIRAAISLGIPYITLYTFSTENWRRPKREVNFLMRLLKQHMKNDVDFYHENHIRLRHAGDLEGLPGDIQREIRRSMEATKDYEAITAVLAINYGGRDEIVRAFERWRRKQDENIETSLTTEDLSAHLDNPDIPDPDLIIRTAGEMRLSNFLLWESAYAELHYSSKLWPDWDKEDLVEAVENYTRRKRKFGGTE